MFDRAFAARQRAVLLGDVRRDLVAPRRIASRREHADRGDPDREDLVLARQPLHDLCEVRAEVRFVIRADVGIAGRIPQPCELARREAGIRDERFDRRAVQRDIADARQDFEQGAPPPWIALLREVAADLRRERGVPIERELEHDRHLRDRQLVGSRQQPLCFGIEHLRARVEDRGQQLGPHDRGRLIFVGTRREPVRLRDRVDDRAELGAGSRHELDGQCPDEIIGHSPAAIAHRECISQRDRELELATLRELLRE